MNRHQKLSRKFVRLFLKAWGSLKGLDQKALAMQSERCLEYECKLFEKYINQQALTK